MNDPIPNFEGHPVDATTLKVLSGTVDGGLDDVVVTVDDVVQMLSQYKVVGIDHRVDPKTGLLVRHQTLQPVEMVLVPINPNDPNDDGVIRALPRPE